MFLSNQALGIKRAMNEIWKKEPIARKKISLPMSVIYGGSFSLGFGAIARETPPNANPSHLVPWEVSFRVLLQAQVDLIQMHFSLAVQDGHAISAIGVLELMPAERPTCSGKLLRQRRQQGKMRQERKQPRPRQKYHPAQAEV